MTKEVSGNDFLNERVEPSPWKAADLKVAQQVFWVHCTRGALGTRSKECPAPGPGSLGAVWQGALSVTVVSKQVPWLFVEYNT